MTEPALTLINTDTGEVVEGHTVQDLRDLNERLQAEISGYRLRYANLQREIRDLQGVEPESEDVRFVLAYWARRMVEEGWFTRKPTFKPGDERWSAVRGRLKDKWTSDDLCQVVEGALAQPKARMKRPWLDATSIFRNNRNAEQHFEFAADPRLVRVRVARELPEELRRLLASGDLERLSARCDCGHLRWNHAYPLEPLWAPAEMVGWEPCRECECMDFDDLLSRHGRAA